MGLTGLEINVVFVSDGIIQKYNKKFLNHDWSTDVIAFPASKNPPSAPLLQRGEWGDLKLLGEVLISTDTAKRQARQLGHSLLTELKILSLHGILHLLGYDDHTKKDRTKMWEKTDALLKLIKAL